MRSNPAARPRQVVGSDSMIVAWAIGVEVHAVHIMLMLLRGSLRYGTQRGVEAVIG